LTSAYLLWKRNNCLLLNIVSYKLIVKYKTAYYSFYLPVALALLLAGVRSKPTFQTAEEILLPMGEYFQIQVFLWINTKFQDDFLDCYGDPKVIGKIGRDIEDNKCSWLVVQALRLATPEQRKILEKHYGRDNAEDVAKVKALYETLNMRKVFQEYEEESYNNLKKLIDSVHSIPTGVFTSLLGKIYKRKL
jgi:farnesyl diphosphate synthase